MGDPSVFTLTPEELAVPAFAFPTLLLFVGSVALFVASHVFYLRGSISELVAVPLLFISVYAAFTPMHDGVHGAITSSGSGARFLNGAIGRVCAAMHLAPYVAFRHLHLQHHRHTNDPANDPDMWSGSGATWLRPLKFFTQVHHYYASYFGSILQRPAVEGAEAVANVVGLLAALAYGLLAEGGCGGYYVLVLVLLPTHLAQAFLSFTFDFLPHRPHETLDIFEGTSLTSVVGSDSATALLWPLTPILLYQNFHVVHHLFPFLPFYHYERVFRAHEAELKERGTLTQPLLPIFPAPGATGVAAAEKKAA